MRKIQKKFKYGLIGKNISYSFSRQYFTEKFKKLKLKDNEYVNFDLHTIDEFSNIDFKTIGGFNVTIPYKEQILNFLDTIDDEAKEIGAVNTIKITKDNQLVGYNTDFFGFQESLVPLLKPHHKKALVLGTGGASKAIIFVLKKLNIDYLVVSRNSVKEQISYQELTEKVLDNYTLIVNCTPLGTYPDIDKSPNIPYRFITNQHLLYDLIYNPRKTSFLSNGEKQRATICNGLKMLELQAEKAWEIWNL